MTECNRTDGGSVPDESRMVECDRITGNDRTGGPGPERECVRSNAGKCLEDLEQDGRAEFEARSPEETFWLGRVLGENSVSGQVYELIGDLGTGKTVFTQGFARGLGIDGPVNSPTFTIQQIYEGGRLPLYHFDVYRIADIEEMEEIGYEDCFYGEGVSLVEWGNVIREILPDHYIRISIGKELEKGFDYRRIVLEKISPDTRGKG